MIRYGGPLPVLSQEKKNAKISNCIITLDIETTSLFHYEDGWRCFRPSLPPEYYQGREKAAVPYIWMMGFEKRGGGYTAIYGREFMEIAEVLKKLSRKNRKYIIWIHNASYEFQFLRDIFDAEGWTVEKMLARSTRKPICWYVPEINIEFRCSYMLTNLPLARAAEQYASSRKHSGDLIYTVPRSPLTELTDQEMGYCEADVIVLCEIIERYRRIYGTVKKIPYTQTGEVRRELKTYMTHSDLLRIANKTPETYVYLLLMKAFQGGITHACYLYAGKIINNIRSGDMASAYPAAILSEKFPMSRWIRVPPDVALDSPHKVWAVLYHVKLYDFDCKIFNRYILGSKALSAKALKMDNGRVISGDMIELVLTDIDYDIILRDYDIGKIEYIETYVNRKDYLPKPIIDYVISLYQKKTMLKGVEGQEDIYMNAKQRINSIFGCCCTNVLKQTTEYVNGEWNNREFTIAFVDEKLQELRKSHTNCFSYSWGVWITAYCRRRTWSIVTALDPSRIGYNKGSVYYDTDSCKAPPSPEFDAAMQASNHEFMEKLQEMCDTYDIDISKTCPSDPKGNKHQIGLWEIDAEYSEFKTLGAKRYAYREKKTNKVKITVSGVKSSTGRRALKDDLNNFKKDMIWDYSTSGKMISCYEDEQPILQFKDCQGNMYTSTQRHGICLMPTTYNMSIDHIYELLCQNAIEGGVYIHV